jgi:general secretion pathway protein E
VHANSALSIIDRLVDLGLPLNMIADSSLVNSLVCQRLVKLLCPHCKESLAMRPDVLSPATFQRIAQATGKSAEDIFVAGLGCEHCKGKGTTGRTVVAEIILPDVRFFELIRAGEKDSAYQYWIKSGGVPMRLHAAQKVADGLVDPRMAEYVVGPLVRHRGQTAVPMLGDLDASC